MKYISEKKKKIWIKLENNVFRRSVSGRLELRLFAAQTLEIPTFQIPGETALFFLSTLLSQKLKLELVLQLCLTSNFSPYDFFFVLTNNTCIYCTIQTGEISQGSLRFSATTKTVVFFIFLFKTCFGLMYFANTLYQILFFFFFPSLFPRRALEKCSPSALWTALEGRRRRNKKAFDPLKAAFRGRELSIHESNRESSRRTGVQTNEGQS